MYRFKVKQCENCLLNLKDAEPEDVEERGGELTGYCPRCYVAYPVKEVSSGGSSKPPSADAKAAAEAAAAEAKAREEAEAAAAEE